MQPMSFLPFARPDIGEEEIAAVSDALRSGWLTTGPVTASFEKEFAEAVGEDLHPVAVNSATAGLHLSFEAIGVKPGDEVLVPTWTFTSTAEAVRYLGGEPVFVDVLPDTLAIDFADAERKVTDRTVAVAPVHYAGLPVPNSSMAAFASRHGLHVVEDAAHAFPTMNEGTLVGASGSDTTVFSFYATKTMTTGEGGMVLTRDSDLAARMRTMRLHGIDRDVFGRYTSTKPSWHYDVVAPGYKYNMTDMAAAIGRVQLGRVEQMVSRRRQIAKAYDEAFGDLPLTLPTHAPAGSTHAWHLYCVRLAEGAPISRDRFIELMAQEGVGTSVHFIPLHLQPYWRDSCQLTPEQFPVATAQIELACSLPIFSSMTDADVDKVISATRSVLG